MQKRRNKTSNAVEVQLTQCMQDIEVIQKELDTNLTLLAKDVDEGFAQLRDMNKQTMKYSQELMESGHEVAGMALQLAGIACKGIAGAYTAAQAASAHNDALAKLLAQKVKIATQKYSSISKIKTIAEKNEATLSELFAKELKNEYVEQDLIDNPETTQEIVNTINRLDDAYKLSRYNLMMVEFLLEEYKAWKNYQQKSEMKRPVMSYVNNYISDFMFTRKKGCMGLNLQAVVSRGRSKGKISGAELLFFTDSSITACKLCDELLDSDGAVRNLGLTPNGIAETLIEDNDAYKGYKSSLRSYNGWWHTPVLLALVIAGLSVWFDCECWGWMSEWWAFFRWVTMIITVVLELFVIVVSCRSLFDDETRGERLNGIYREAVQKQLDEMGYVEIYEPDFEEKSVLWEGTKGLFKGMFS